ncbi:hypothetical protein P692DRAFT_20731617 [Suillus brevipes Sb2]|nr:hypothetical protein P692DRAFT_20731617 [Suillus brevipes Sb2]
MLTSLARFTVTLVLASSVFGAVIPVATVTTDPTATATPLAAEGHVGDGALWKNNVHYKISEAPAPTAIAEGAPSRRSGELWRGLEHEEVARDGGAPSRRSGELWRGLEHEEVARDGSAPSRRSGELWRGLEHVEVSASP